MTSPLTAPQTAVLRILAEQPDGRAIWPRAVARAMWPDSEAWQTRTRIYGANRNGAVGGTMPMKAAQLLWRLCARGCAEQPDPGSNGWVITERGRGVLAGTAAPAPAPARVTRQPVLRLPKPARPAR